MPPLADVQRRLRDAIVGADAGALAPMLVGGANPGARLAIHRRHYQASLVGALLDKFPATTWLVGSSTMYAAARAFIASHPPATPCISEYGEDFPQFLGERAEAQGFAYVGAFAELEWHLGQASIAIDLPAISLNSLADHGDRLVDIGLVAQPGLRYLAAAWPVDELMKVYLTDTAPDRYAVSAQEVWLEIRGVRGSLRFDRLARGDFVFRQAIASGAALGVAAERALASDPHFDIADGLQRFVMAGLASAAAFP